MKVMLIYVPIWKYTGWRTSCNNGIGLLSIGAVLRKAGHTIRIIDAEVYNWWYERILEEIEKWNPTHIGISCLSNGLQGAIELTKLIKSKYPNTWVALGGVGPSSEPEYALKESGCDSVTVREAELILDKSFGERGIHYGITPQNLDDLPDPAYDLLEPAVGDRLWSGNLPVPELDYIREIMVMWSRGCPHPCTFCSKSSIKRGPVRKRSKERIASELKMLVDKFSVNSVFVYDDELIGMSNAHNEWMLSVLKEIEKENLPLILKGQGRCSKIFVTEEIAKALKQAGFFAMMMGCESGSEKVKERIKKHTTNEDIRCTLKILHEAGIKIYAFWMIGMPEETSEEAKKTENLIIKLHRYMDWIQITVFSPLIGSDFWNEAVENRWLKGFDKIKNFQNEPMLDMPWMTQFEILRWQKKLYNIFRGLKNE